MNQHEIKQYFDNLEAERARVRRNIKIRESRQEHRDEISLKRKEASIIKDRIADTYDQVVALYKEHDKELAENPALESYLKRSYGSRAGGIACKRNKLKKYLEGINEQISNYSR
jgi:hypothetical protein